jgi:uncharacterized repeat protein (TIGR01451 family)
VDLDPDPLAEDEGIICDLGSLAAGEEVTVSFDATPTTTGTFEVLAVLSTTTSGVADADDSELTTVQAAADLAVDLVTAAEADDDVTVADASPVPFVIAVHNAGPNAATGVVAQVVLPTGAATPTGLDANCDYDPATRTVTCLFGTVAAGATETADFTTVLDVAAPPATVTATATVDGDQPDPVSANNTDAVTVHITAPSAA